MRADQAKQISVQAKVRVKLEQEVALLEAAERSEAVRKQAADAKKFRDLFAKARDRHESTVDRLRESVMESAAKGYSYAGIPSEKLLELKKSATKAVAAAKRAGISYEPLPAIF